MKAALYCLSAILVWGGIVTIIYSAMIGRRLDISRVRMGAYIGAIVVAWAVFLYFTLQFGAAAHILERYR